MGQVICRLHIERVWHAYSMLVRQIVVDKILDQIPSSPLLLLSKNKNVDSTSITSYS